MGILQARILEWVAMPSSMGSSQPKDRTQVSCMVGRSFTNIRELPTLDMGPQNPPLHQEEKNRPHDIKELRKESLHFFSDGGKNETFYFSVPKIKCNLSCIKLHSIVHK